MKLSRDHRMIIASYVAKQCGWSDTEQDLATIVLNPGRDHGLKDFHGSKAERKRVELAFDLLEAAVKPSNTN